MVRRNRYLAGKSVIDYRIETVTKNFFGGWRYEPVHRIVKVFGAVVVVVRPFIIFRGRNKRGAGEIGASRLSLPP